MLKKISVIIMVIIVINATIFMPVLAMTDKNVDVFEDENIYMKEKLDKDTQEAYDEYSEINSNYMIPASTTYTVAIANPNNTYTTIKTYTNFQEAKSAMNENPDDNAVVISNARTIGNKVIAMKDGIAIITADKKGQSTLTLDYTYVNNYNDAYYYDSNGTTAKIGISGQIADSVELSKLELIPRSQIEYQSYYTVNSSNEFKHYVARYSYNKSLNRYVGRYEFITICEAPDFMTELVPYYSLDGQIFYSDKQLTNLAGVFYPYYKFLTFRSKTTYTANQLDSYIASWNKSDSVLNGKGQAFINAQNNFGVNGAMLLGFAILESGYGTSEIAKNKNNLFGINAIDDNPYGNASTFNSVEDCIYYQADYNISKAYTDANGDYRYHGANVGNKNAGINVKYASDPYWGEKIAGRIYKIDKFLGMEDIHRYQLAVSNKITYIKKEPASSASNVYKLAVKNLNYPIGIPILLLENNESWYRIQSDMPINSEYKPDCYAKYNYSQSQAYAYSKDFLTINNIISSNNYLSNISLDTGFLSPIFNKNTHDYIVNLNSDINNINITPQLEDQNATYIMKNDSNQIINNPVSINIGENIVKIQVTSERGKTRTYTLSIYVSEPLIIDDGVSRIAGKSRWDTATFISETGWIGKNGSVILTSGEKFPDALAASPLAHQLNAPILLCKESILPEDTLAEIQRVNPKNIYILGGPATIDESIKEQLEKQGYTVIRISSDTRFTTAIQIGEELRKYSKSSTAIITFAYNYPDALSIGPVAAKNKWPILFTETTKLTGATKQALLNWGINEVKIIGGPASVSDNVKKELEQMGITVERIWGQDREEVAIEVAKKYNPAPEGVIITTGYKFTDALTGGPLAGKLHYPIILVKDNNIKDEALNYIKNCGVNKVVILGGEMSVNQTVRNQIENVFK